MDLNEFADNPIIDELIWVREALGPVSKIVPVVTDSKDLRVDFIGPDSLKYEYSLSAGHFAKWWSDAVEILSEEGVIDQLLPLDDREREILQPGEERVAALRVASAHEKERLRVSRLCGEASKAFYGKDYQKVVSLLSDIEPILDRSILGKLHYARRHAFANDN